MGGHRKVIYYTGHAFSGRFSFFIGHTAGMAAHAHLPMPCIKTRKAKAKAGAKRQRQRKWGWWWWWHGVSPSPVAHPSPALPSLPTMPSCHHLLHYRRGPGIVRRRERRIRRDPEAGVGNAARKIPSPIFSPI